METGVIAKDAGVDVDTKKSGQKLGDKEKSNRDVEPGFFD